MQKYLELAAEVLAHGTSEDNRTDQPATKIFGSFMRFDLSGGKIAAVTTKRVNIDNIIHELLWLIAGDGNIRYLQENGVNIWNEWADQDGNLGPTYPVQWRRWPLVRQHGAGIMLKHIDQLANLVDKLRNAPTDRRMLVNAWNVGMLDQMNLPPCHWAFQVDSAPAPEAGGKRQLRLMVHQRSVDVFLGLPYNLSCYSILAHMLAQVTDHEAVELIHVGGNVHVYDNHHKQMRQQIKRKPKAAPTVVLNPACREIDDFGFDDISIEGYECHGPLRGKVAV